ncbi:hypothetical protein SBA5_1600002 [Candidatus Sulfotelmatomonas gaucii]|uniref:Uncharacterized protein n=1 Tax=Candidatus Sulfuritelmatomonas gaucii TaxID=2043161 RepID=A0A2N9L607_9BACT|nr:hypothetical protein SBA5_1600002 [Candidatus Sulfotelmatomonas gaucii]
MLADKIGTLTAPGFRAEHFLTAFVLHQVAWSTKELKVCPGCLAAATPCDDVIGLKQSKLASSAEQPATPRTDDTT